MAKVVTDNKVVHRGSVDAQVSPDEATFRAGRSALKSQLAGSEAEPWFKPTGVAAEVITAICLVQSRPSAPVSSAYYHPRRDRFTAESSVTPGSRIISNSRKSQPFTDRKGRS